MQVQWQPTPVFLPGDSHGWWSMQATVHSFSKSWTVHRERRESGYPGGSVVENRSARQKK